MATYNACMGNVSLKEWLKGYDSVLREEDVLRIAANGGQTKEVGRILNVIHTYTLEGIRFRDSLSPEIQSQISLRKEIQEKVDSLRSMIVRAMGKPREGPSNDDNQRGGPPISPVPNPHPPSLLGASVSRTQNDQDSSEFVPEEQGEPVILPFVPQSDVA